MMTTPMTYDEIALLRGVADGDKMIAAAIAVQCLPRLLATIDAMKDLLRDVDEQAREHIPIHVLERIDAIIRETSHD